MPIFFLAGAPIFYLAGTSLFSMFTTNALAALASFFLGEAFCFEAGLFELFLKIYFDKCLNNSEIKLYYTFFNIITLMRAFWSQVKSI